METSNYRPDIVISGPLKRTLDYSRVIADHFKSRINIDLNLIELNYGLWEGLNNQEVIQKFGQSNFFNWENNLAWPGSECEWGESFDFVLKRVDFFLESLLTIDGNVFICTSNGILRFIQFSLNNSNRHCDTKVKTGNICLLSKQNNKFIILDWDINPSTGWKTL